MTKKKTHTTKNGNKITIRKARQIYSCKECFKTIDEGTEYIEVRGKSGYFDGYYTMRICKECMYKY